MPYKQQDIICEIRDALIDTAGQPEYFVILDMQEINVLPKLKKDLVWKYGKTSETRRRHLLFPPLLLLRQPIKTKGRRKKTRWKNNHKTLRKKILPATLSRRRQSISLSRITSSASAKTKLRRIQKIRPTPTVVINALTAKLTRKRDRRLRKPSFLFLTMMKMTASLRG